MLLQPAAGDPALPRREAEHLVDQHAPDGLGCRRVGEDRLGQPFERTRFLSPTLLDFEYGHVDPGQHRDHFIGRRRCPGLRFPRAFDHRQERAPRPVFGVAGGPEMVSIRRQQRR
jgi:hypothetical protein